MSWRTSSWLPLSTLTRLGRRLEASLLLGSFCLSLAWGAVLSWGPRRLTVSDDRRRAVAVAADRDADGLPDAAEEALLRAYAPHPQLSADEGSLPASVGWVRRRAGQLFGSHRLLGAIVGAALPSSLRKGSDRPGDWTVYGHAYPRADGGVELQYWFYFPYNDGPLVFDHDSDWEHVSVELGPDGTPVCFALAAHNDNAPGRRVPWDAVPRDGNHPRYLVAAGTHAAYLSVAEAPFWDRLPRCREGSCDVREWRPGAPPDEGGSPLVNVGEFDRLLGLSDDERSFFEYAGVWGPVVPAFASSSPWGPPLQRGFCVDARPGSCR